MTVEAASHEVAFMQGRRLFPPSPAGFTLVEILLGLSILALLTSASLGIRAGVDRRVLTLRAASELIAIQQSLESYRRDHGDYPMTGACPTLTLGDGAGVPATATAEVKLFNALCGRLSPSLGASRGRVRLDLERLSLVPGAPLPAIGESGEVPNALVDPWGRPYVYRYRSAPRARWNAPSFLLYSLGPDGGESPPVDGVPDFSAGDNVDNVYVDR